MKLYSLSTPSHEILKKEWFLATLRDPYEVIFESYGQECLSGEYKSEGWKNMMSKKVDLVLHAIRENWGTVFIYSDVDVQFFARLSEPLLKLVQSDIDMLIQRDSPQGTLCAGFFVCRGNSKTLALWEDIKKSLELRNDENLDDQDFLNKQLIRKTFMGFRPWIGNSCKIKWRFLPNEFFNGGTLTGKQWSPGMSLLLPKKIVLHHANWTVGVENKIKQLQYVKDAVNGWK